MLKNLTSSVQRHSLVRLASVSNNSPAKKLRNRGISIESLPTIIDALRKQRIIVESSQLIDENFEPSIDPTHPTPYPQTRFSAGGAPVFYSSLEDETSIEEVRYYQVRNGEFHDLETISTAPARHFNLFEVDFEGDTLDLFEIKSTCPELTSQDNSGYKKCRELASEARSRLVSAFLTPSARKVGGRCVPVFERKTLGNNIRFKAKGRFVHNNGQVVFERL